MEVDASECLKRAIRLVNEYWMGGKGTRYEIDGMKNVEIKGI